MYGRPEGQTSPEKADFQFAEKEPRRTTCGASCLRAMIPGASYANYTGWVDLTA